MAGMTSFTFEIVDDKTPVVTINDQKLSLVSCVYMWATATESTVGVKIAIVSGFLIDEFAQRNFRLVFSTGEAIEIIN